MPRYVDMSGLRCGLLTVGARVAGTTREAKWVCACDCGSTVEVAGKALRRGQYSCGCVNYGRRTHGMAESPTYACWVGMRSRCRNPNVSNYADYGGRGITVCDRWDQSFENFFADMGPMPEGHSIERRDNDLGYEPDNCYWLPQNKQSLNRRNNVYVEIDGETVTAAEAARRLGVKYTTFLYRVGAGRSIASMKEAAP